MAISKSSEQKLFFSRFRIFQYCPIMSPISLKDVNKISWIRYDSIIIILRHEIEIYWDRNRNDLADSHLKFILELPPRTRRKSEWNMIAQAQRRSIVRRSECASVFTCSHYTWRNDLWAVNVLHTPCERPEKKPPTNTGPLRSTLLTSAVRARARRFRIDRHGNFHKFTIISSPFSMHANNKSVILPSNECSINGQTSDTHTTFHVLCLCPVLTVSVAGLQHTHTQLYDDGDMWHRARSAQN